MSAWMRCGVLAIVMGVCSASDLSAGVLVSNCLDAVH